MFSFPDLGKRSRGEWTTRCADRLRELIPMLTEATAYSTALTLYPRSMDSVPELVAERYTQIALFKSEDAA